MPALASLPSHVLMSWVNLPKSLHLCVFPSNTVSSVVGFSEPTATLLSDTKSWTCLGPWHRWHPATGRIAAVLRYGQQTQGKSRVLMELPLPSSPSLHTQRPVQGTCGRLDSEERLALQADRGGALSCRGEEGEAQMAADALISENDRSKTQNKKNLATGEQPNKNQHRGRKKGSRPDGPLHRA